ncbi:dephospho-CoA kinase [Persephonella sp.]
MLKVGLTGSIGTGKSTVARLLEREGAYVIDADRIVHDLLNRQDIREKIRSLFGDVFREDGSVDRKKLAKIVFSDETKKKQLESIIHPEVFKEIEKFFSSIRKKDPDAVAVAEVPLMIETGSYKNYDVVVVVYAPFELQLKRLLEKGMDRDEAIRRIKSQMSPEEKVKYADFVIDNTGSLESLEKQVKKLYRKLKKMAEKKD